MSLTKRALAENVDVTDPRDTGNYGQPDEPTAQDWAIAGLFNEISSLEKHGGVGYVVELKEARQRLQKVIDNAVKPF